ncbi:MAG: hypothetical protein Q4G08_00625 [Capnocytophaga sp.]|nr:hypothetical protein [Capnocytophaga sp.]
MEKVKTDMREINRSIEKSIEKTRTLASLEEVLEEEYYRREDSFSPFGLDDIDLESLFRDND